MVNLKMIRGSLTCSSASLGFCPRNLKQNSKSISVAHLPHHPSKLFHFYQPSALGFKGSKSIFEPEYTLFWDEVCHLGTPGSGDIDICDHVKGFGSGNVSWCFFMLYTADNFFAFPHETRPVK